MRVDVSLGAGDSPLGDLLVVVDVFRSSSSIVTALDNGAKVVIPFSNISKALRYRNRIKKSGVLLVGERNGITPKGFDYNISPFDMSRENVEGKTILYTSSNLTRVLRKLGRRNGTIIGSFNNARAVAEHIERSKRNVSIVACGGIKGPTIEDVTGAGVIASQLRGAALTDRALLAVGFYKNPNWPSFVKKGRIATALRQLGLGRDVDFCLSTNRSSIVPVTRGNQIIRFG